jgi:hypothetical protein
VGSIRLVLTTPTLQLAGHTWDAIAGSSMEGVSASYQAVPVISWLG